MAEALKAQRLAAFGGKDHIGNNYYDEDDEYGGEDDDEQEEDEDDEEDDDDEIDEEAAARMMMMMDEQEKLFMQQQMLEREYLKAAAKGIAMAGKPRLDGEHEEDEEVDVPAGYVGAPGDHDLILAGGMGDVGGAQDESAYNKLIIGESDYQAKALQQQQQQIEIKSWIDWHLSLQDHDFMVHVEREYILDKFNLINLRETCGHPPPMSKKRFKETLKLILSSKVPNEEDLQNQQFLDLNQDAFDIYGRIH